MICSNNVLKYIYPHPPLVKHANHQISTLPQQKCPKAVIGLWGASSVHVEVSVINGAGVRRSPSSINDLLLAGSRLLANTCPQLR